MSKFGSNKLLLLAARSGPCYNLLDAILVMEVGLEGLELAYMLVDTILDKKGGDIVLLDLRDEAIFTDYFLICNGENNRQLRALADSLAEEAKKKADLLPWGTEGEPNSGWVLLDYGNLIVHLFSPEKRHFYNLEELWNKTHVVLRMQ